MYEKPLVGPALGRLRRNKRLKRAEVATRLDLSESAISRIEATKSNPHTQNLLRYLNAIDCTLSDLDIELRPDSENEPAEMHPALADAIARDHERLKVDPGHREGYRRLFAKTGYKPDPEGPLRNLIEQLERFEEHDARVLDLDRRLRQLETSRDDS